MTTYPGGDDRVVTALALAGPLVAVAALCVPPTEASAACFALLPVPFVAIFTLRGLAECVLGRLVHATDSDHGARHARASMTCFAMGLLALTLSNYVGSFLLSPSVAPDADLAIRTLIAASALASVMAVVEGVSLHRSFPAPEIDDREPGWW